MNNVQRRLAAVLELDVVGYSRMMGANETGTLVLIKSLLADIINPAVAQFNGRVVKLMGDGVLAEFDSAINAVQCAHAIQISMRNRTSGEANVEPAAVRIGINLGDIIIDGEDIFGDGVNLAARLEGGAQPGGICISAAVHDQIVGKVDIVFEDGGNASFKNIERPVHVWHWPTAPKLSEKTEPVLASTKTFTPSIAVLPFINMSNDPEQDYFADGLTEDLITALSRWRSIPVIDRNSAFTYKGGKVSAKEVAADLKVRFVLEGSVRKAGNRLRVTTQLVDGKSGCQVWTEKFDRQLEDIFDVQDEITGQVAAIVVPEMEAFEQGHAMDKPTENFTAWDFYLRGMATFHDETCAGTAKAMDMFQKAVEIDPNYSDAWARLAWCYSKIVMLRCSDNRAESLQKGFESGRRAVSLDDASAMAHCALGVVHVMAEETELGLEEALRAVELNPYMAHAAMAVGNRLDLVGRTEEGIEEMQKALMLNPRDPVRWRYMAYLSRAYISLNEYQKALEWGRKSVLLRPDLPEAQFRYAVCLAHMDRVKEAREALDKCSAIDPGYLAQMANWQPYSDAARSAHVMDGLRRHQLL